MRMNPAVLTYKKEGGGTNFMHVSDKTGRANWEKIGFEGISSKRSGTQLAI